MDERRIIAAVAQTREGLKKHLKEKAEEKKDKDNRNMYLATEGIVRPGICENLIAIERKVRDNFIITKCLVHYTLHFSHQFVKIPVGMFVVCYAPFFCYGKFYPVAVECIFSV